MQDLQLTTHDSRLNIICFDVPFPADYGGSMEEFYKLKALAELGVKIHLHCFVYGDRKPQDELKKYCEQVYYYERKKSITDVFSNIPFIVKTRANEELLQNLLNNDFPILFDATHSTFYLNHPALKDRKKHVRLHNIEWIYYSILSSSSYTLKEQIFHFLEYKKLRKYDETLINADSLSCLSQTDYDYYSIKFPNKKISLEYVFHENTAIKCKTGKGNYILYHGNLSVLDNYKTVMDLLNNELENCTHNIIIAGKNPPEQLKELVERRPNIHLLANPSNEQLDELIMNAQICFAVAGNPSGIKLKLINSMYRGRFIFSNEAAFAGSGLDACVVNMNDFTEELLNEYMQKEFTQAEVDKRTQILNAQYNNLNNAQRLADRIFNNLDDAPDTD
ncbi:MAG: glycosyltransferase [Chitinophagales bacterium]